MRFTAVQVALFKAGVSFVHMAPTEFKRLEAFKDFLTHVAGHMYYAFHTNNTAYLLPGSDSPFAKFMVCRAQGESTQHVPVIFMDGKKAEFPDQHAYDEARWIAADIDGCGPMVVR